MIPRHSTTATTWSDFIRTNGTRTVRIYSYKDRSFDQTMWCVDPMWNDGEVQAMIFDDQQNAMDKADELLKS